MNFLAQLITWINVPVNAAGRVLLAHIGVLPGWLSNTIISAVMGLALMFIFKYTSNQNAIGKVKDLIKANMLALRLYKDSMAVTLQSQGRLFKGAFLLLFHAIRPMLVMIIPVSLLFGQMGLWYQARPLLPGEDALVTMKLNGQIGSAWPEISIASIDGAEVIIDQTRAFSIREIFWKIKAKQPGQYNMIFRVDGKQVEKELVVGDGFTRLSAKRPGWKWIDILWNPVEEPFGPDSVVQSVSIEYPERLSWTSGTDWWVFYCFGVSIVFALIFKPFLKVKI